MPRYQRALEDVFGPGASFRPGQREAIVALVEERRRGLLVQATGWGKSLVYFFATRFLREDRLASGREKGLTLVISPLLALMRNQVAAEAAKGLVIETVNSTNNKEWSRIKEKMVPTKEGVDLLLISPERFSNQKFIEEWLPDFIGRVSLLVVDEAHLISEWGHDFRPDYQRLRSFFRGMPKGTPLALTTATANDRVVKDIEEMFRSDGGGTGVVSYRGSLSRTSLVLAREKVPSVAKRYALVESLIRKIQAELTQDGAGACGIVYVRTKRATRRLAEWLKGRGFRVESYTGGNSYSEKEGPTNEEIEGLLSSNELDVVVATTALGMGYDKPDLAYVIHFNRPQSIIEYYQQVGRAGRQLEKAYGILFEGTEDSDINKFFRETAIPSEENFNDVLRALESMPEGAKKSDVADRVNIRPKRIEHILKHLSVMEPSPIIRKGYRYFRNFPVPFIWLGEKNKELLNARESDEAEMMNYMGYEGCLMEKLQVALNDRSAQACGRCQNCAELPLLSAEYELFDEALENAQRFIDKSWGKFGHRKMWPTGFKVSGELSPSESLLFSSGSKIPEAARIEDGMYLARYDEGRFGKLVKVGKYGPKATGKFSEELVEKAAEVIQEEWKASVEWVTCVPSLKSIGLVPDLAERIAGLLGIGFIDCIEAKAKGMPQKERENSNAQLRNLLGRFEVKPDLEISDQPVLLIDDMVDSRWTLTVVGGLLRGAGSGLVFPFALGDVSNG